jgi:TPR repeat protein
MGEVPEDNNRTAGLAASDAGRFAEAYRLLAPLAEAGDAEAQGIVGSLMQFSFHRYVSFEEINAGTGPAIDEATALVDQELARRYLEAASAAGIGPASFNLAGLYVGGYGDLSWEKRKARVAELYELAYSQGFTAFGRFMQGGGPGQTYLDVMERHMEGKQPDPPEWWPAESCAVPASNERS